MKTIVFAGPSLADASLCRPSTATFAPPIKRGDLVCVDGYDVVVIVDGEFGQTESVSPKEILAVIESGKTVIGAASMGALRASELDRFGMIGVGWVYEYFRRQPIRRDADVALAYSSFDFEPMTVPMVDVEYWVERALTAAMITREHRTRVLNAARKIFFADRTAKGLLDAMRRAVGEQVVGSLLAFSGGKIPSIKSLDAVEAVRLGLGPDVYQGQDGRVG
jgi:hypothetical protein